MSNNSELMARNKAIFDNVLTQVNRYCDAGSLALPKNYSPGNALRSAQLIIANVKDRNDKLAMEVCDPLSISRALMNTLIQGLNPTKNQCYYIVYNKELLMQRSYYGEIHVAKSCDPEIQDIYADVVYKGDTFEYSKKRGVTTIDTHKQTLDNIKPENIIAAYCVIIYRDGHEETTIMTIDEIHAAWKKSPMKPIDDKGNVKPGTTHAQYPAPMAKRTVIRRACTNVYNSSDDSQLLIRSIRATDDAMSDAETESIIDDYANVNDVDINDPEPVINSDTGEAVEQPKAEAAPY